jgi:hypothetical protein
MKGSEVHVCEGLPMKSRDCINASEVGQFVFCRRAWFLARCGHPSTLEKERRRGTAFHERHSGKVRAASRAGRLAKACAAAALIFLAGWLWWIAG